MRTKFVVDKTEQMLRNIEQDLAFHIYCAEHMSSELENFEVPVATYMKERKQLEREIEALEHRLLHL